MSINKNIVVFIRSHNDFDHILPILDYLINVKLLNVTIYGVTSQGYEKCEKHILYVTEVLKTDIIPFEQIHYNYFSRYILILADLMYKKPKCKLHLLNLFFAFLLSNFRRLIQKIVSIHVRKFIINLPKNTILLADFSTENHFPYKYFIKYSNKFNIPIVAYLHGYYIFDNLNPIKSKKQRAPSKVSYFINKYLFGKCARYYDGYLVGTYQKDKYFKSNLYGTFTKHSRVIEIGVPRFTREWISKFSVGYGLSSYKKRHKKSIKVALFVSNIKFGVNTELVNKIVNKLVAVNGVDLKIVSHTRGIGYESDFNASLVAKKSSSEIIEWADIGIVYGSSMIFEMLVRRVTVVIPKFIDSNTTIFEGKNICIESNSVEDLVEFICDIKSVENKINNIDVDNFINEYVYANCKTYEDLMDKFYYNIINFKK